MRVPKGDPVPKGETVQVPVVLEQVDSTKVSSVVYYTYVGEPVPMVVVRGRPRRVAETAQVETQNDQ